MEISNNGSKINLIDHLFNSREYSDIQFNTIDDKIVKAHKIVLAYNIEYFNNLFKNNKDTVYNIETTFNVINEVIRYAYTGSFKFDNQDDLAECLLFTEKIGYIEFFDKLLMIVEDKNFVRSIIKTANKRNIISSNSTTNYCANVFEPLIEENDFKEINKLCEESKMIRKGKEIINNCKYNDSTCQLWEWHWVIPRDLLVFEKLPDFKKYGIKNVYMIPSLLIDKNIYVWKLYVDKMLIYNEFPWINSLNFDKIFNKPVIDGDSINYFVLGNNVEHINKDTNCFNYMCPMEYLSIDGSIYSSYIVENKDGHILKNVINYNRCKQFCAWHLTNLKKKNMLEFIKDQEL